MFSKNKKNTYGIFKYLNKEKIYLKCWVSTPNVENETSVFVSYITGSVASYICAK